MADSGLVLVAGDKRVRGIIQVLRQFNKCIMILIHIVQTAEAAINSNINNPYHAEF